MTFPNQKETTRLSVQFKSNSSQPPIEFFFDSEHDRNCCNQLFMSIINKSVKKVAKKYGMQADLEIGCQKKSTMKWQPRILSIIQNRILLFRDKSQDPFPLSMISVCDPCFAYYKADQYHQTVEVHCSDNQIMQFHLGDDTAVQKLNSTIEAALKEYNPNGLQFFDPHNVAQRYNDQNVQQEYDDTQQEYDDNRQQYEQQQQNIPSDGGQLQQAHEIQQPNESQQYQPQQQHQQQPLQQAQQIKPSSQRSLYNNNNYQQQQQQQQQPQRQGRYGGGDGQNYNQSQMSMNQNEPWGRQSEYDQSQIPTDSNVNLYYQQGTQAFIQNSNVLESQMNIGMAQSQISMTQSQMSIAQSTKVRLKPLRWDKPLKKGKQETQIFIWGKARPPTMFPQSADQMSPYHVDRLSNKKIWDVCAAREGHHCFGIGMNDWVFVWGETKQIGALGLSTNARTTTPFLLRSLKKRKIKQVCCSAIHGLAIDDQLIIYGWGAKALTLLSQDTQEPHELPFVNGKGLKKMAACNTHSVAWHTDRIDCYTWGMPGPWLGLAEGNNCTQTLGMVLFDDAVAKNDGFAIATCDISSQYSIFILNNGYVGACGVNEHGRMGVGKGVSTSSNVIWNRKLQNIVLCSAASFHSGFVDTEGRVFTCGVGNDYRLGHGNTETLWEPTFVESLQDIQVCQIECVDNRTFVITPQGNLIMWGKEPVSGRVHEGPFVYEYLSSYRMYDICGATDFCVAIGVRSKHPIPRPKIANESVDSMNPNAVMSNVNSLIAEVIGNYHPLGKARGFNVDQVMGNFITLSKTEVENSKSRGPPRNVIGGPPINTVGGPPMDAGYGSQRNVNNSGYGQQQQQQGYYNGNNAQYQRSQRSMYNQAPQQYEQQPAPPQQQQYGNGSQYGGSQRQMYQNQAQQQQGSFYNPQQQQQQQQQPQGSYRNVNNQSQSNLSQQQPQGSHRNVNNQQQQSQRPQQNYQNYSGF